VEGKFSKDCQLQEKVAKAIRMPTEIETLKRPLFKRSPAPNPRVSLNETYYEAF